MTEKIRKDIPRERLLDEAEALFAERGYNAVTVREISALTGIQSRSINGVLTFNIYAGYITRIVL